MNGDWVVGASKLSSSSKEATALSSSLHRVSLEHKSNPALAARSSKLAHRGKVVSGSRFPATSAI
jgi:hypothetical protein